METQADFIVVERARDRQLATVGHGLTGIANEIIESLFQLVAIEWHRWHIFPQLQSYLHAALLDLWVQELHCLLN